MLKIASPLSNLPPFLSPQSQIASRIKSKELNTHNIGLKHYVTHLYSIPKIAITLLSQNKNKISTKEPHAQTCIGVFYKLQSFCFAPNSKFFGSASNCNATPKLTPLTQFTPKKSFIFLSCYNCPLSKSTDFSHAQTKKHKAILFSTYIFLVCFAFSRLKRVCSKSLFMSSCKRRSNVKHHAFCH